MPSIQTLITQKVEDATFPTYSKEDPFPFAFEQNLTHMEKAEIATIAALKKVLAISSTTYKKRKGGG